MHEQLLLDPNDRPDDGAESSSSSNIRLQDAKIAIDSLTGLLMISLNLVFFFIFGSSLARNARMG
jgi:hypothetical protein